MGKCVKIPPCVFGRYTRGNIEVEVKRDKEGEYIELPWRSLGAYLHGDARLPVKKDREE